MTKETCLPHKKKRETEVTPLNDLASRSIQLQRRTAHKLAQASYAVVSLVASLRRAHREVRKSLNARYKFHVNLEQSYLAEKRRSTSGKNIFEDIRGLLAQASNRILQLEKDHEEQLSVEKGCDGGFYEQKTCREKPGQRIKRGI